MVSIFFTVDLTMTRRLTNIADVAVTGIPILVVPLLLVFTKVFLNLLALTIVVFAIIKPQCLVDQRYVDGLAEKGRICKFCDLEFLMAN